MSDYSHTCVFYSDDAPDGEGPRLELTFSEDYYLAIIPPGDRTSSLSIRFRNSGARRPDVTHTMAVLRAVIRRDKQAIVDLSLSLMSLAGCDEIKPSFHRDPRAPAAPPRDRTETPRLYESGGFCYAAMQTHPRDTYEEAIHAHIDDVLATFSPDMAARIEALTVENARLREVALEAESAVFERDEWRARADRVARRLSEITGVPYDENDDDWNNIEPLLGAEVLSTPSSLEGIDDDPERWAALHDPMLQTVYAWRAEQLREGGQALTTVPFMAMVEALRKFRATVAASAMLEMRRERDDARRGWVGADVRWYYGHDGWVDDALQYFGRSYEDVRVRAVRLFNADEARRLFPTPVED